MSLAPVGSRSATSLRQRARPSKRPDATAKQIQAVTGHQTLSEVERYTAAAKSAEARVALQAFEKQAANKGWRTTTSETGKPKDRPAS